MFKFEQVAIKIGCRHRKSRNVNADQWLQESPKFLRVDERRGFGWHAGSYPASAGGVNEESAFDTEKLAGRGCL